MRVILLVFLFGFFFFLGLVGLETEVETSIARLFNSEVGINLGLGIGIEFGNATRNWVAINVLLGGFDKRIDVADFGFDFGVVGVFFDAGAAVGGSGALEIAESIGEGVVTAA